MSKKVFIILLFGIFSICFMNFEVYAEDMKEITIRYLDEDGNEIKEAETKLIEMGEGGTTRYILDYKEIENATDLFAPYISGYISKSAKMKTYYDGVITDTIEDDNVITHLLEPSHRVAIINPHSEYAYVVDFIYEKTVVPVMEVQDTGETSETTTNTNTYKKKVRTKKSSTNTNLNTVSDTSNVAETSASVTTGIINIIIVLILFFAIFIVIYNIKKNDE